VEQRLDHADEGGIEFIALQQLRELGGDIVGDFAFQPRVSGTALSALTEPTRNLPRELSRPNSRSRLTMACSRSIHLALTAGLSVAIRSFMISSDI